jgi:hypothetical protein
VSASLPLPALPRPPLTSPRAPPRQPHRRLGHRSDWQDQSRAPSLSDTALASPRAPALTPRPHSASASHRRSDSRVRAPRHCRGSKPHTADVRSRALPLFKPRAVTARPRSASAGKGFRVVLITTPPLATLAPSGTAHFSPVYPCAGHLHLRPRALPCHLFQRR